MSKVLVIEQGKYKCSACNGSMTDKDTARGVCPSCGEQLTEVLLEAEYKAAQKKEKKKKEEEATPPPEPPAENGDQSPEDGDNKE